MTGKPNSNSTSEALARAAFRDLMAARAGADPNTYLSFTPATTNGSFFVTPSRPRVTRQAMEEMGNSGELAALESLWRSRGHLSLLHLIPLLQAIADQIASERRGEESGARTPSHLIYQMY